MKRIVLFLSIVVAGAPIANADTQALPAEGFDAAHYETLWTKSPFSVATPDAVEESADYVLVGIMQLEGIAYASIVDNHSGDHLLISSDKAFKGLKLVSITHSRTGSDTFAALQKDGQPITLKLQSPQLGPTMPIAGGPGEAPPIAAPNITMPGANLPPPGAPPLTTPPGGRSFRVHRPTIHLPPMPGQQPPPLSNAGNAAPPPPNGQQGGQPVQPHNVPPNQ